MHIALLVNKAFGDIAKMTLTQNLEMLALKSKTFRELLISEPLEEIYTVDNGVGYIEIPGVIVNLQFFDIWDLAFGRMIDVGIIAEAIKSATNDKKVKRIVFKINSPGGTVTGIQKLAKLIDDIEKPTSSVVISQANSAAYWLASQTDNITATSDTDLIGSIGT